MEMVKAEKIVKMFEWQLKSRFPREFGNPARQNRKASDFVWNEGDLLEYIEQNNGKNPCFISLYGFRPTEFLDAFKRAKNYYEYAIIDTLFFDFDLSKELKEGGKTLEDVWMETKKFVEFCLNHKFAPRIAFSGCKGFHVYLDMKPIKNIPLKNETLMVLQKKLIEASGVDVVFLDKTGTMQQMTRLINTVNTKTGLYCIPLSPDQFNEGIDEILNLAKKPNMFDFEHLENEKLTKAFLHLNRQVYEKAKEKQKEKELKEKLWNVKLLANPKRVFYLNKKKTNGFPPCIIKIFERLNDAVNLTHTERFTLVAYLHAKNWNEEEIVQLFRVIPDFDEKRTRYQVHHIFSKNYKPPSCAKRREWGLCVESCPYAMKNEVKS